MAVQQLVMGNPKALGHTHALQRLGLEIARPVVPHQEIARAGAHPAGPVEEQNSGHTFIVHRGARSVTAWRADMTDVILSTVSPAYSAVRSTTESGIPTVGAMGENSGRPGVLYPYGGRRIVRPPPSVCDRVWGMFDNWQPSRHGGSGSNGMSA